MALASHEVERRATLLIDARRYKEAIALLADALANEQTARLWCCMALAHWRLGSAEETLHAAEQAIALNPELEWGHRLRGLSLGRLDRTSEGLVVAMFVYSRTGDLDMAERTAQQVLRIDPDSSHALHVLGWVQLQRGHREQALPIFERALVADPTNRLILGNVFDTLLGLERYDEAADLAGRMIDLAPDVAASWCSLGLVRFRQGRYSEAADASHKAVALDPQSEWAHRLGAVVAGRLHDDDEALRLIRRATELDRQALSRQVPWLTRAAIAARLGLMTEAEESLTTAAELDPTSVGYHRQVAEVADRAGDCARAAAAAQAALARAPFSLEANLAAGKATVCAKDWPGAAEWYLAARKHSPRDCCARAGQLLCRLEMSGPSGSTKDELDRLNEFTHDCRCTLVERLNGWVDRQG